MQNRAERRRLSISVRESKRERSGTQRAGKWRLSSRWSAQHFLRAVGSCRCYIGPACRAIPSQLWPSRRCNLCLPSSPTITYAAQRLQTARERKAKSHFSATLHFALYTPSYTRIMPSTALVYSAVFLGVFHTAPAEQALVSSPVFFFIWPGY